LFSQWVAPHMCRTFVWQFVEKTACGRYTFCLLRIEQGLTFSSEAEAVMVSEGTTHMLTPFAATGVQITGCFFQWPISLSASGARAPHVCG